MEKVVHPVYRVHRSRGGGDSPVHRGPGGMPHRSGAHGWLQARLLAAMASRGKGGWREPHHGRRWAAREWSEAGVELQRQRLFALDDKRRGAGRDEGWSSFGRDGKWPRRRGTVGDKGVTDDGSMELQCGGGFRLWFSTRGGETKGRDQERKCRRHGSLGGGGAEAASDRRREMTRVGRCWAERLLWLGPRLPGRIEGMNRKGL
jgi:hypothetical protein